MSKQIIINYETFEAFNRANPDIYRLFKSMALYQCEIGNNVSAAHLIQRIRWEYGKKIPNATSPYYARRFVREYPNHIDKFKFAKIKG